MNEMFKEQPKLVTFLITAILSVILAIIQFNFGVIFWIVLFIWIIIYIVFFIKPSTSIMVYFWITILIAFIISISLSFKVINLSSINSSTSKEVGIDGVLLSDCTSTINDQPKMIDGWKSTIYSAELNSNSPDPDKANNVKTFSYNGIKNKTEKNSVYNRIEKIDGSYITGYGTTIEACTADNKTAYYYTTADTTSVASENVVASVHYLHGGKYLHGSGDYRIDAYIKTTDGKWHLVDRMTGIKITD